MFIDGLHNSVDIYALNEVGSNKLEHDRVLDHEPKYRNMNCRIIKDEKAIFEKDIFLKQGDVLYNLKNKKQYNVKEVKRINGLNHFHHLSCKIELRRIGDIDGRSQYTSRSSRLTKLN